MRAAHGSAEVQDMASLGTLALDYQWRSFRHTAAIHADCFEWLGRLPENSLHAVVTDPPYGVKEYNFDQLEKKENGNGGIWRIPPSFDGHVRSPLPRFTALDSKERDSVDRFFFEWGKQVLHALRPGGHVFLASNSFLSQLVFNALVQSGLEFRGEFVRLVRTLRGGDRPKNAEDEFPHVVSMPRGCYEPWGIFRKPIPSKMTVAECLRTYQTGGLRRLADGNPFSDVVVSERTPKREREIANHPSIKPQSLMRQLVRAALPLGEGVIADPFMGSGSTVAAAEALGLQCVGIERYQDYFDMASAAIPLLSQTDVRSFLAKEIKLESQLHLL
jgi:site-specific DNA-methyltransferase (adenine-specific)